MKIPKHCRVFDLTKEYNADQIQQFVESGGWGIGGYLENRKTMYLSPLFENKRCVHMGIDIWAAAGEPVYAPLDGVVSYKNVHIDPGNYGGAIVLKMSFEGKVIYGLFGHLSWESVEKMELNKRIKAGEQIGRLGNNQENGSWPPHLHFQISNVDPGQADMPGVVAEEDAEKASKIYPDPRIILGPVY